MLGAVSHEDEAFALAQREQAGADRADSGIVVLGSGEQRPSYAQLPDGSRMLGDDPDDVVELGAVHYEGRLHHDLVESLRGELLHGVGDVVDADPVALVDLLDDHAAGPGAPDLPIGELLCDATLDGVYGLRAGVVVAGSEAGD